MTSLVDGVIAAAATRMSNVDFWLNSALLISVGRALWVMVGKATETALFRMALRTTTLRVRLTALPDHPATITALRLLFIRHGNDTYLQHLASDQEKHHGKLRNKVLPVTVQKGPDGVAINFRIRVHTRLGTQFKLFVDVAPSGPLTLDNAAQDPAVQEVVAYLKLHPNVHDVSVSGRPGRARVFFLLRDFDDVQTIEGFRNNMIWPV
ncbi:MAG: hypothetical protein Q7J57_01090 [Gemmobacter sp.]|nr:hypothetical protein [Gemmobacter sp.]